MMASGLLLLPCAFLKNLRAVSSLSFWNGVVHVVINAVILAVIIIVTIAVTVVVIIAVTIVVIVAVIS